MADPIYLLPEPRNGIDFRTHFFAPVKYFGGKFHETLWFNIAMVWLLTISLYIVLYYDLLAKTINFSNSLKYKKKKPLKG